MKRLSRLLVLVAALFGAAGASAAPDPKDRLFDVVPPGDATYERLGILEAGGLVPGGSSTVPLTRFEVAKLILGARERREDVLVAQAGAAPADAMAAMELERTAAGLGSLEEAYQYELEVVRKALANAKERAEKVDAEQYRLLTRLDGITQFPGISIHGLGRAFVHSRTYSGDLPAGLVGAVSRDTTGFLDLQPRGVVSRHANWDMTVRVKSGFQPNAGLDGLTLRRISLGFHPEWFSADLGDFREAYTPLTLWNRSDLDLLYLPEPVARRDRIEKYEEDLDEAPRLPFRGMRLSTSLLWPKGGFLSRAGASVFAHMVNNGFNDLARDENYIGPNQYTGWILAGRGEVRTGRWGEGGKGLQGAVEAHGVVLDEPLNTDKPGSPYLPGAPATWAHQYRVGSVKPSLEWGFGGGASASIDVEAAGALYRDDKLDASRDIQDLAVMGGPSVRFGDSRAALRWLDVGPRYYSPLAQVRQDDAPDPAAGPFASDAGGLSAPEAFRPPVRSRYLFDGVPRACAIYSFYDRTRDNAFPYGWGTPNRRGGGVDVDLRVKIGGTLRIPVSAYRVREEATNDVVDSTGTGFTPIDGVSKREFTYVNLGPSFDLGPAVGWGRALEVGANFRFEDTKNPAGRLTGRWALGGVRAGLTSFWDASLAYGRRASRGREVGVDGTLWARYPYLFDNADLGRYVAFDVDGKEEGVLASFDLHWGRHSRVFLDYGWSFGDILPYAVTAAGRLKKQNVGLIYEIRF